MQPDENGKEMIVVGATGVPLQSPSREIMGNIQADFKAGVSTMISWRDLSVSALVDGQKGGLMYSNTASINYFVGNAPQTIYNDRQPLVVPNSVRQIIDQDDASNIQYYENTIPLTMDMIGSPGLFGQSGDTREGERSLLVSRTNIRLREVVVSYRFPQRWFTGTPIGGIQLSATGNNLLLWRPDGNRFIDPEASTMGNNVSGEFGEMIGHPSVRTFGFNVKVTF
jgi:hypothetical protein